MVQRPIWMFFEQSQDFDSMFLTPMSMLTLKAF